MKRRVWPSLVRLTREVRAHLFRQSPAEEVDEELDFHVEMRIREHMRSGLSLEEAKRLAVERFGDIEAVKEACRRIGRRRERRAGLRDWWEDLRQDTGFGLRQVRRNPGFSAVVVVTLGLAIGANSAVFSVVNTVLIRPLPYSEPDRLVALWTRYLPSSGLDIPQFPLSPPEMIDYREQSDAMQDVVPYIPATRTLSGTSGQPERVEVAFLGAGMFDLLGVRAEVGRVFAPDEEVPDAPPVVVLGHGLWSRRFGGEPGVVGETVLVNGRAFRVTGVMSREFGFPDKTVEMWLPLGLDEGSLPGRSSHYLQAVGRLAPGYGLEEARAELETITAAWYEEYEHHSMGHFIFLRGLHEEVVGSSKDVLWLLMAAVGLVLLVACANVANLMLARTESREREVTVRLALGAGRGRLVRQFLTESLVLAAMGALVGLGVAYAAVRILVGTDPTAIPRVSGVDIDTAVLHFTAVIALGTALLFGLVPAIHAATGKIAGHLRTDWRATGSRGRNRLRRGLVAVEAALALLLVAGAGLVTRSLWRLSHVDPGSAVSGIVTMQITIPSAAYPTSSEVRGFFDRILERIEGLPGVEAASAGSAIPVADDPNRNDFLIRGAPLPDSGVPAHNAGVVIVRPDYFETLGIPVTAGRVFRPEDGAGGPFIAVMNRATSQRYWPEGSALGRQVGYDFTGRMGRPWMEVVGIVGDTKVGGLDAGQRPLIYLIQAQADTVWGGTPRTMSIVVRAPGETARILPALRRVVAEMDPTLAPARLLSMSDVISGSVSRPRLTATLLGSFGLIALVLAVVGIYGVVSYTVSRRTREIGIRMALGAAPGRVARMVVREGSAPALVGVGLGLAGAAAVSGYLSGFLFQVSPTDPFVLGGIALLLIASALAASALPAWRTTRVQPTRALDAE